MIQAVILAGGRGTRLRPFTINTPKSMVLINGKPFLHHLLDYIKKFNFKDILICGGYLSKPIIDYFGDGKKFGFNIKYSIEKRKLLGTGGALKNAKSYLSEKFLLLNGDTYLPINYLDFINFALKRNVLGTIVVDKKNKSKSTHAGIGLYKKSIIKFIPNNKKFSLEKELFPVLLKKNQLKTYVTNKKFYDIGTPYRLKIIKNLLKFSGLKGHLELEH